MTTRKKTNNKSAWDSFFARESQKREKSSQNRTLKPADLAHPGTLTHEGREILNLSSNDYLGFAADPLPREDIHVLADIVPVGGGSSRLLHGSLALHTELEKSLAALKGTPGALVFPSGFQANLGLISALGKRGVTIFNDRLNHASLIDGCRLAEATSYRYRHNDVTQLESAIVQQKHGRSLIVTDGVFSMDGDLAPLSELNRLSLENDAMLIVDEAHATGVLGKEGRGSWHHCGLEWHDNVILMGTLSKAFGLQGGFVCASEAVIDYLINACRTFIYTTAISPLLTGIAHSQVERIREADDRRERLFGNVRIITETLRELGIEVQDSPSAIVPIILKDSALTVCCADALWSKGIAVGAVRPPTVPEGTARLRLSLSAAIPAERIREAGQQIAETIYEQRNEEGQ